MVHDAARCADHDVRAESQTFALRAHGAAADQREDLDVVHVAREAAQFLRDLVGQFARGAQHHGLHAHIVGIELGQQRQAESGSLAAAGLGLGDQVLSGQRDGQALGLDRRHAQVAELLQVAQHGGR